MHVNHSTFSSDMTSHIDPVNSVATEKEQESTDPQHGMASKANGTYYREYVPLQRVPMPDEDSVTYGNFSNKVYIVYSPSQDKTGRKKSKDGQVNLTILPLSTLLVLFVYSCFKITQWCGEDIREADDKMLQFFLPMHRSEKETEDKPTRMPRRTNSMRSRSSQGTYRSNSLRSSDSRRMVCTECHHGEFGPDSPLARRILTRHNRYSSPTIIPGVRAKSSSSCGRHLSERRHHRTKSKSRDSLHVKNGVKDRWSKKNLKRREHEWRLISMPLELHFSHMMLGRNRELPSASTPSSASQSTSTGLSVSESVPVISMPRSDSRKTSLDSGAVALGSQSSSSQTDVTSTPETTTTTGFSSDSMGSPGAFISQTITVKHTRTAGRGYTPIDPLSTIKPFWEQRRQTSSKNTEEPYNKGEGANGFVKDSFIMSPHGGANAVTSPHSGEDSVFASPVISPEDFLVHGDLCVKSPRSSHSSDTAATVLCSPSRSLQDPGITGPTNCDGLNSRFADSIAARDARLFYSSSWDLIPDATASKANNPDCYTLSLRTISLPSSKMSQKCPRFNCRRSQISVKRDSTNGIRKSLSADGSDVRNFAQWATTSQKEWRPCSLYFEKEQLEMDCFKGRNNKMKWCMTEPVVGQSPTRRRGGSST